MRVCPCGYLCVSCAGERANADANARAQTGSWPVWFAGYEADDKHDFYDRIHSTWVCTQALRDRDFKVNQDSVRLWQVCIQVG